MLQQENDVLLRINGLKVSFILAFCKGGILFARIDSHTTVKLIKVYRVYFGVEIL